MIKKRKFIFEFDWKEVPLDYDTTGVAYREYWVDEEGRKQGRYSSFDENGVLEGEINYKDDILHGAYLTFNEGMLLFEGQFINGKKNGEFNYYGLIDGELLTTQYWENNVLLLTKHFKGDI